MIPILDNETESPLAVAIDMDEQKKANDVTYD